MTEQSTQDNGNVLVPNPPKVWKNLFSWLDANTTDDEYRINLKAIWLDDNHTFWATNGYALVRAELDDDTGTFLTPGHWFINVCTTKLVHFIKADVNYPDVHSIWDSYFTFNQNAVATFDPGILANITKPFGKALMHMEQLGSPMHIVLGDPKAMPEGIYSAILMPMNIKEDIRQAFVKAKFNVEYLMPESFDFYSDPGHGWLEVPMLAIKYLDIADRISEYSYVYFGNVYLEEDEDMSTFFTAYRVHYGKEPVTVQKFDDEQRIRTYRSYSRR